MIKISNKTTISNINKYISLQVSKGLSLHNIMEEDNLLHNLYNANKIDLIEKIAHIYGKESVNIVDNQGRNLLHKSIRVNKSITFRLIKCGVYLDKLNNKGYAPFHTICECYNEDDLKEIASLTNIKSIINLKSKMKDTPIMISIIVGNYPVTDFLLKFKPNLSIVNIYGNNCLFIAVIMKHKKIVERLLKTKFNFPTINTSKINIFDMAYITHDNKITSLIEESYLKKDKVIEIDAKDQCHICESLLIEPIILKCNHRYCMSCFLMSNPSTVGDDLSCPFRCESGNLTRNNISINKEKVNELNNKYDKSLIENRVNIYYFNRAYILLSQLGILYNDFSIIIYKGGFEFKLKYSDKKIKIKVKINLYVPTITNIANNIMKLLLEANNPPSKVGIGAIYIKDDYVYSDIDIPITYLNSDTLEKILDSIIIPIQTLISSITTFANVIPININLPILQNIEKEFLRKPKLTDILEDLHNTKFLNKSQNLSSSSCLNVEIATDNCFVELSKIVGLVAIDHSNTYNFLLSYRPPIFEKIHNVRISTDKQTGIVYIHAIIIYAFSTINVIQEQYNLMEEISEVVKEAIKVNCQQP